MRHLAALRAWLTPPIEFNDPFDMGINVVVDGSLLPKLASRIRQAVDRGMPNASQGERPGGGDRHTGVSPALAERLQKAEAERQALGDVKPMPGPQAISAVVRRALIDLSTRLEPDRDRAREHFATCLARNGKARPSTQMLRPA